MAAPRFIPYEELIGSITRDVSEHQRDLSKLLCERHKVSRVTANRYIQRLERDGWISRSGPSTHPVYAPGYMRRLSAKLALAGLQEDVPWQESFAPYISAAPNIKGILQHGFTEMVNNAIDHSEGTEVFIYLSQDQDRFVLMVVDNGIGIFKKIADALGLADHRQAIFELAKGKLTTDPSKHSGEGVFFTSRMFDRFAIQANHLNYSHKEGDLHDWLRPDNDIFPGGTEVFMAIGLESQRTTTETFLKFMNAPEDFGFNKTIVPMKLARYGDEQLVSRSQAKRLIARFDRFKVVLLDFEGVSDVGQAFADELFRVYAREHPDVELLPINISEQIERMWRRAITVPMP